MLSAVKAMEVFMELIQQQSTNTKIIKYYAIYLGRLFKVEIDIPNESVKLTLGHTNIIIELDVYESHCNSRFELQKSILSLFA